MSGMKKLLRGTHFKPKGSNGKIEDGSTADG